MIKEAVFIFLFFLTAGYNAQAGDIRAGNMRVEQLSLKTVRVTVNLYTQIHSTPPQLELCWGDGTCENWSSILIDEWPEIDSRHYQMQTFHEYQAPGFTEITAESCCWTGDLKNLSSSTSIPFKLTSRFKIDDGQNTDFNTTPEVQPFSALCPKSACAYLPQVTDLENDSLFWTLCTPDLNVYFPLDEVAPSPNNQVSFNPSTGGLSWISPPFEGLYSHIACLTEKRDGAVISESEYFVLLVVDNSLPIVEPMAWQDFKITPNPVEEEIRLLQLPEVFIGGSCRIYDAKGKLYDHQELTTQIMATYLNPGFYILVIENEGWRVVRSFIKS